MIKLKYVHFWLRFKAKALFRPTLTCVSAPGHSWQVFIGTTGFIIYCFGKRLVISWHLMLRGPCCYADFAAFHREQRP